MTRAAFTGESHCTVSDIEVQRTGSTYAFDTLTSLTADNVQLRYIVGSDTLAALDTWHRITDVVRLCDFLVVPRPGVPIEAPPISHLQYTVVPMEPIHLSSTDVRDALMAGGPRPDSIPDRVWSYIASHQLYGVQHSTLRRPLLTAGFTVLAAVAVLLSVFTLARSGVFDTRAETPQRIASGWVAIGVRAAQSQGGVVTVLPVGGPTAEVQPLRSGTHGELVNVLVSKGPERYAVPNLVGNSLADAKSALAEVKLDVGRAVYVYDNAVPSGRIISSRPASGTIMQPKQSVDVTISKGPAPVPIPNVSGKALADAASTLTAAGFTTSSATEFNDTVKSGLVISTDPRAGVAVQRGSSVKILVSKGPAPVKVPDVFKLSRSRAESVLKAAGLKVTVKTSGKRLIFKQRLQQDLDVDFVVGGTLVIPSDTTVWLRA